VRVNVNEHDEITASVAAHQELGPGYESAVAEGLVERIGEEIDRRIDARLGGQPAWSGHPGQTGAPQGGQQPAAYRGPVMPPAPPPAAAPPPAPRRTGALSGVVLGLGTTGLGLGATAVVVAHHVQPFAEVVIILLIWAAIALINVAHSQRKL
jgi:hypothetical protein